MSASLAELQARVKEQGDLVREAKKNGISKEDLAPMIVKLKALKLDVENATPKPAVEEVEAAPATGKDPAPQESQDSGKLSKKALKKLERQKQKEEQKAARAKENEAKQAAQGPKFEANDDLFCVLPMIQSQSIIDRKYLEIHELNESLVGSTIWVRARIHNKRQQGKKMVFLTLRHMSETIQCLLFADNNPVTPSMIQFVAELTVESIVDIEGEIKLAEVKSATKSTIEIHAKKLFVVSKAQETPIQLEDCARSEAEILKGIEENPDAPPVRVQLPNRLDNRVVEMRTPANQGIWRMQSKVCELFREYFLSHNFTEIHTPKLISAASEGGANVFKVTYFERAAYLAQSPQLYKQMAICGDMDRVFEIAPVFRAENSFTHRHLTEFMGLDMEMAFKNHYHEVLDVICGMFEFLFTKLRECESLLAPIQAQYPHEPIKFQVPTLRLNYPDGVKLLREAGIKDREGNEIGDYDDFDTPTEKALGKLVKEKYDVDFYVLDRFPSSVRPFYTMHAPDDPNYSNSYDFFLRGEEILSGAQRIHDPELLLKRAVAHEIEPESIQGYLDAFKYGAPPHAGAGIGMERLVMLYLGLDNVRKTSMFPRDPKRLQP